MQNTDTNYELLRRIKFPNLQLEWSKANDTAKAIVNNSHEAGVIVRYLVERNALAHVPFGGADVYTTMHKNGSLVPKYQVKIPLEELNTEKLREICNQQARYNASSHDISPFA